MGYKKDSGDAAKSPPATAPSADAAKAPTATALASEEDEPLVEASSPVTAEAERVEPAGNGPEDVTVATAEEVVDRSSTEAQAEEMDASPMETAVVVVEEMKEEVLEEVKEVVTEEAKEEVEEVTPTSPKEEEEEKLAVSGMSCAFCSPAPPG